MNLLGSSVRDGFPPTFYDAILASVTHDAWRLPFVLWRAVVNATRRDLGERIHAVLRHDLFHEWKPL